MEYRVPAFSITNKMAEQRGWGEPQSFLPYVPCRMFRYRNHRGPIDQIQIAMISRLIEQFFMGIDSRSHFEWLWNLGGPFGFAPSSVSNRINRPESVETNTSSFTAIGSWNFSPIEDLHRFFPVSASQRRTSKDEESLSKTPNPSSTATGGRSFA